jgi:hypothetical protein
MVDPTNPVPTIPIFIIIGFTEKTLTILFVQSRITLFAFVRK